MATLTKREAIRECKRLWKEIEKLGLTKTAFLHSSEGRKWVDKHYDLDCPLCGYIKDAEDCETCPLMTQYGKGCFNLGFGGSGRYSSPEWFNAVRGLKE